MKYFLNTELVKLYNVSEKTVRNWIEATLNKKLLLDLYTDNQRSYIADTINNSSLLPTLVEQGRKFRNQRSHKHVEPKQRFYDIFTDTEIQDLINEIEIHSEFPLKYRYFEQGGDYWEQYLSKLQTAGPGNILTNTIEAIQLSMPYIDAITSSFDNVNLVNLCVGNSVGMKDLVEHFSLNNKLREITCIDISERMLELSKRNIQEWNRNNIPVKLHKLDITRSTFNHVLSKDSYGDDASRSVNIHLLLAGALVNFRDPDFVLRLIGASLAKNDLLIITLKRDTHESRRFFDFNINSDKALLNKHDNFLLELLNIDGSIYDHEQLFDKEKMARGGKIRLKIDLSIEFMLKDYHKTIHLRKGQAVKLWHSWHHSDQAIVKRFDYANLHMEQFSKSSDDQLMMIIGKIKEESSD